jgi:RNA polymerase sigma factor (sigma-70 family)
MKRLHMYDGRDAIKVGIVDSSILFRAGLTMTLNAESDLDVVAEAQTRTEAIALLGRERPDIVLMDGGESGTEAELMLHEIGGVSPASKVVILAMHDQPRVVQRLLTAGARAYVLKSTTPEELIAAIRTIHRESDRVILSISQDALNKLNEDGTSLLSPREREVISLVYAGMRNAEIAAEICIAEGTVKRHLTNIYTKLGAASRMDAVNKAVALGLLLPRAPWRS